MRSIQTIAFAASLAVSLTAASATEWRKSIYETDGFSADFSGGVKVEPMDLGPDKKGLYDHLTMYSQDGGDHAFFVGALLVGSNSTFDFNAGVAGTMKPLKCTSTQSDVASSTADGEMREIHASGCNVGSSLGARFFSRGRWFYQVFYLITSDSHRIDAQHFLTSFKLIPLKR